MVLIVAAVVLLDTGAVVITAAGAMVAATALAIWLAGWAVIRLLFLVLSVLALTTLLRSGSALAVAVDGAVDSAYLGALVMSLIPKAGS